MGMPAARVTDLHTCPMVTGLVPHVGGPILPPCAVTVLIGSLPAARVGDLALCAGGPDTIVKGSLGVFINGQPAARIGDLTVHGGVITTGLPTVLIGDIGSGGGAGAGSNSLVAPSPADEAAPPATPTTGLGKDVDALVAKSPTLTDKLTRLQKDGWTILTASSGGSYANRTKKTIVVDTTANATAERQVKTLAHEAGHADYKPDPQVRYRAGMSEDEYASGNAQVSLKDEGEATLTNIQVRNEIKKAGGPDIGLSGKASNHAAYEAAYETVAKGGDRDAARNAIGNVFADGEKTSNTGETYRVYYEKKFREYHKKVSKPSP